MAIVEILCEGRRWKELAQSRIQKAGLVSQLGKQVVMIELAGSGLGSYKMDVTRCQ